MSALRKLNVLYCHGLGSSINCRHATQLQAYFENKKNVYFERLLYKNPGSYDHIWNVNEWKRDIEERINSDGDHWVLMATSGACHAALNIAKDRKDKISGLFLMCPGTSLDMDFVETIQPGTLKYLMKKGTIKYPPSKHGHPALLNVACLEEFLNTDICKTSGETIDIECPVLAVHGTEDTTVPVKNTQSLVKRISSNYKDFYAIPGVDHYFDLNEEVMSRLDKLMNAIEKNKETRAKI